VRVVYSGYFSRRLSLSVELAMKGDPFSTCSDQCAPKNGIHTWMTIFLCDYLFSIINVSARYNQHRHRFELLVILSNFLPILCKKRKLLHSMTTCFVKTTVITASDLPDFIRLSRWSHLM